MYSPRQGWPLLMGTLLVASCASEQGRPPVARITAEPRAIPEHDGFQTDVILDGTTSADPIDDPDGTRPLSYAWEITGDEVRFQQGTPASPTITVRFLGDRPATVRLTVTDEDGHHSTARLQMQLTLD